MLVILGDGYTEADLAAGAFSNQVARFLTRFFAANPWSTCGSAVNVYRVDIASNESGADFEDAPPAAGGTLKDTYLDAQFWSGGMERALTLSSTGVARAFAAADALVGPGVWDEILVFVNSTRYGGSGGAVGVSSVHPQSDEIQLHELGHSFAYLADEYDYGSTGTGCADSGVRNVDCGLHFPQVKWGVWVEPGTPMPTPETDSYAAVVGAFEGAFYQPTGIYRPMLDCTMRSLGAPFCPVCQEAHLLQFFERLNLIDEVSPAPGPVDVLTNTPGVFSVTAIPVPGIEYQWWLDGTPLTGQTNPTVILTIPEVTSADVELRAEIMLRSPLVRSEVIQTNLIWHVHPVAQPSLALAAAAITEGDTGTQQLLLTATLSTPSPATVAFDYATQDGTATAGDDFTPVSGQLIFTPGTTTQTVPVPILGDRRQEPDETFILDLRNPRNVSLPSEPIIGVIVDDDAPPAVALTSPHDGAVFWQGENLVLAAEARDPDGIIDSVSLLDNGSLLSLQTAAPYLIVWTNASPGVHSLVAVATDNSGRMATSAPIRLTLLEARVQYLPLVPLTNAWKYDATTNDYGGRWRETTFDDGGWTGPSGAVFFMGNLPVGGPKNTPLPRTDSGARIRAYYFRTRFHFPEPPPLGLTLRASNLVDDGAVFYLNGLEVGRLRMPEGPVDRSVFALPGPLATNLDALPLRADSLVHGENLLAVEVHTASDAAPAVTFGLSLEAIIRPPLQITVPPQSQVVNLGSTVTFVAMASGDPPPTFQWFRNDTLEIPGGTASTLVLTNVQDSDAGYYSVRVKNDVSVLSANALLTVNHLPEPVSPVIARLAGQGVKCRTTDFLGTDPDGDPLSLLEVAPTSAHGGAVRTVDDWVVYLPPPTDDLEDSFSFHISDGRGGSAMGIARVIVTPDTAIALSLRAEVQGDGSVWLRCDGVAGKTYAVQFTEALTSPDWQTLALLSADSAGAFEHVDRPPPGAPQRFYRVAVP